MIRRFIKSSIAIVVALSFIMAPNAFMNAKVVKAEANIELSSTTTNKYEKAIQLANTKASLLTSLYGETSIQYALIDEGEIVISGQSGVYNKENTTKLTNNHIYGIGSVSKVFTTVAVMQLVEQGKINLDTPVVEYIPTFKMKDYRYKDITVRMLLNHSSGLLGSSFQNTMLFNDNDTFASDNLLSSLAIQRLKADPGEFSVYCNDGFSLAQLVVEKVSGISFSKYMKLYISDPLGIKNTKTPLDDFDKSQLVKTYAPGTAKDLPIDSVNAIGAGGIYSTAEELCYFAEIFMKDTASKVLTNTSANEMAKAEYLNGIWYPEVDASLSYGLGWDSVTTYPFTQYGIKALAKGGDTGLFHCSLIVLPEDGMAMAVLSSGGASTYNQVFAQEVMLEALLAKGSLTEIKANKTFTAPVKTTMPSEYKEYAGFYAHTGGVAKIEISKEGVLSFYDNEATTAINAQKFYYTGEGRFYFGDGSAYISFVKESNGNVYLNVGSYATLPVIGQMASAGYQAQKIAENKISKKVKAAWNKRENKSYFIVNEKYSSQMYALSSSILKLSMSNWLEGYFMSATIIDANHAETLIQIPGMYGRDLSDYHFYKEGKVEYLEVGGRILISQDAVKALSSKASFKVTIGTKGYASWYTVSKKQANKKIKVTLPKNASYTVYDSAGTVKFNSLMANQSTTTLPSGGHIVFVGKAGAKFSVKYVK